jgi:hypothetical protein
MLSPFALGQAYFTPPIVHYKYDEGDIPQGARETWALKYKSLEN